MLFWLEFDKTKLSNQLNNKIIMTDRQAKILAAIVEQHAELSYPVGSVTLAKLFQVSSSTIRGEMVSLEKLGYIAQPHTSAGRVPTDQGYRWYVNQVIKGQTMVEQPTQVKAFDIRVRAAGHPDQALKSAIGSLVDITTNASFGTAGPYIYTGGLERLLSQPEFSQPDQVKAVAYLFDNLDSWLREAALAGRVNVFIGQENPIGKTSGCSLIIGRFKSSRNQNSYIGLIGPTRQPYRQTMSLIEHASSVLESVISDLENQSD